MRKICLKKICLLLALCLTLTACSAFAEEKTDVSALVGQIQEMLDSGEYESAAPLILEAAEAGDAQGQLWLGNLYGAGIGVEQDESKAAEYYGLSAE